MPATWGGPELRHLPADWPSSGRTDDQVCDHALEVMPPTPLDQARSRGVRAVACLHDRCSGETGGLARPAIGRADIRALRTQRLRRIWLNPTDPDVPGERPRRRDRQSQPSRGEAGVSSAARNGTNFGLRRNPDPRSERRSSSAPSQQVPRRQGAVTDRVPPTFAHSSRWSRARPVRAGRGGVAGRRASGGRGRDRVALTRPGTTPGPPRCEVDPVGWTVCQCQYGAASDVNTERRPTMVSQMGMGCRPVSRPLSGRTACRF
jgi:hypothetical protein